MLTESRSLGIALACAALACLVFGGGADAAVKKKKKAPTVPFPGVCAPVSKSVTDASFQPGDAWLYPKAFKFPFNGYTPAGPGTVIWKNITESTVRKAKYPTANMPSCRVGRNGTEDRVTRKASKWFKSFNPVDGVYSYTFKDTFDRPVATLHWEEQSLRKSLPDQWGWYLNTRWAGHDATRAFEVQGNACKLRYEPTTNAWVRDPNYVMVAFNPGLGQSNPKNGPKHTSWYKIRAFVDRRAVPAYLLNSANRYDFGCGASSLPPMLAQQTLQVPTFKSGYGPNHSYLIGQYIGEGATTLNLLPGERQLYNNYSLSTYNPKPQFFKTAYAMASTTAVAGGGMVRGIVRSETDKFTLLDEMTYCDPNYTLRNMQITRFKKHYRKDKYFMPALYSVHNRKNVRWVFGRIDPEVSTLPPEQATASANPGSIGLYAWMPVNCDR
jgi:hypothetical protein